MTVWTSDPVFLHSHPLWMLKGAPLLVFNTCNFNPITDSSLKHKSLSLQLVILSSLKIRPSWCPPQAQGHSQTPRSLSRSSIAMGHHGLQLLCDAFTTLIPGFLWSQFPRPKIPHGFIIFPLFVSLLLYSREKGMFK